MYKLLCCLLISLIFVLKIYPPALLIRSIITIIEIYYITKLYSQLRLGLIIITMGLYRILAERKDFRLNLSINIHSNFCCKYVLQYAHMKFITF